jgi:Uncharacterized conserved protein (DUF2277)
VNREHSIPREREATGDSAAWGRTLQCISGGLTVFRLADRVGWSRGYPKAIAREQDHVSQHQDLVQFRSAGTDDEVRGAALQFVRKLSGFNTPSKINAAGHLW